MALRRARGLADTWLLAQAAGARFGVTRLPDIGGLTPMGVPVFQAVRPYARSLTVSQGKGGSALAAKVSALLESVELACAEALPKPATELALAGQPEAVRRCWSGERPALAIDLDPDLARPWVAGQVLATGAPMPMPWDLLSLDFTRPRLEYAAGSDGLASGNTRDEALLAALCELVEHDMIARFHALRPHERHALQIDCASIADPILGRELRRIARSGFTPRMWSIGQHHGIAVVYCALFPPEPALDAMAPVAGTACHPDPIAAARGALQEAVQGRASLVAGARDDIRPGDYTRGPQRTLALALATLAFADGSLPATRVPARPARSYRHGVEILQNVISGLTPHPVVVLDHEAPVAGLFVVHALAPGLRNLLRRRKRLPARPDAGAGTYRKPPHRRRAVLFAGPSIHGLTVPQGIALRPPAVCGDLGALLDDPPAAVGLIDGHFGLAPTVWHKEILALLALGVRVLGAASIGALRAAELERFGMEGIGAVFAAYRDRTIERDDAVMLLQAPADFGFAPLTLTLVDAEFALATVVCEPRQRRMMLRIVRTTPYELRTWDRCLDDYRSRTGQAFPVPGKVLVRSSSRKRQDAALLIERLEAVARDPNVPARSCQPPPPTSHYLRMLARRAGGAVPGRS